MNVLDSLWGVRCVWLRYFDVLRKSIRYYLVTTFTEPILYLLSFGLGVGALVGSLNVHGVQVSYRSFVLAGIIGQTVLFQGFYEASFGGFVRMYYQKIFSAMAVTPITLSEVLWGELLWCGEADHLDILGHFHDDHKPRHHVDWMMSGAHFTRHRFNQVIDAIAAFILRD